MTVRRRPISNPRPSPGPTPSTRPRRRATSPSLRPLDNAFPIRAGRELVHRPSAIHAAAVARTSAWTASRRSGRRSSPSRPARSATPPPASLQLCHGGRHLREPGERARPIRLCLLLRAPRHDPRRHRPGGRKGQVIGTVGRTGNAACSTPHLHFEVKCGENGEPFDPYPWLGTGAGPPSPPAWPSTERLGAGVVFSGAPAGPVRARVRRGIRSRRGPSGGSRRRGPPLMGAPRPTPMPRRPAPAGPAGVRPWHRQRRVQLYCNGSAWGGVTSAGSARRARPPCTRVRRTSMCSAAGTDMALYQRSGTPASVGPRWFWLGGSPPRTRRRLARPRLPPAGVRPRADDAIWQMFWTGTAWTAIASAGYCTSGPSAVTPARPPGRLLPRCRTWRSSPLLAADLVGRRAGNGSQASSCPTPKASPASGWRRRKSS